MIGKKVLIIDDDVDVQKINEKVFRNIGAIVKVATNGTDGVRKFFLEKPDLVITDIMMPEMDGLTAMRAIREQPEWRKLPIIALTAKAMKNDQEQALAAGANDYMAKPLDVDQLLSLVRVWMPR